MSTPVDARGLGQELASQRPEPPPPDRRWWEPLRTLAAIIGTFLVVILGGTKLWGWIQSWEPDPLPPGPAGRVSLYADPTMNEDGEFVMARGELQGTAWEISARIDPIASEPAICLAFLSDSARSETTTDMCGINGVEDFVPPFSAEGAAPPRGHVEAVFVALCDPSVTRFEVELQGGIKVPGQVVPLPDELGLDHGFLVASFAGDLPGSVVTYDASGDVVSRIRL